MLALLVAGILCGQNGYRGAAQWARATSPAFKRRLGFIEHDTPAPSTFCELLKELPWKDLEGPVRVWSAAVLKKLGRDPEAAFQAVALDGKRLRGSAKAGADLVQYLSVVSHGLALTLGNEGIESGKGELSGTESLLAEVLTAGCVLTADAQFTQRKVAEAVLARGADYLMMVKGNQPKLQDQVTNLLGLGGVPQARRRMATQREAKNGRQVERDLVVTEVKPGEVDWPGVQQVFWVRRCYYYPRSRKHTLQVVYGVTSMPAAKADAKALLALARGHWTIETGAFWVRDVELREDAARIAYGKTAMAMAVCRGLAMTALKASGRASVAQGRREMMSGIQRALRLIGA
jgi:predicted transposase YbfD/YdcC